MKNMRFIYKILDSIQKEVEPSRMALTATKGENEFTGISEAREEAKRRLDRLLAGQFSFLITYERRKRSRMVGLIYSLPRGILFLLF